MREDSATKSLQRSVQTITGHRPETAVLADKSCVLVRDHQSVVDWMRTVLCGPVAFVDQQSGPADEDGGLHGRVAERHERLPLVTVEEGQLLTRHRAAYGTLII